jgi:general secretion pathway protein F
MAGFRYTAIARGGETTSGVMEADSEAEVIARLQREGSIPLKAEPDGGGGSWRRLLTLEIGRGQALSRQELADVTRELSLMLGAGQDLDRALRFLLQSANRPRLRQSLQRIRDSVRDGASLASAMSQQPRNYPRLYVGLVRAGETGGTLAATLDQVASLLERERALSSDIQSALIYPTMLLLVAIVSVALLLTQVLPQFVPLFEQNAAAMPGPTLALITAGNLVSDFGLAALLALLLLGILARMALGNPAIRTMRDRWLLRLPVLGSLARDIVAARFTRTLGTLLTNGVALVGALAIARETLGNLAAVAALDRATLEVKGGGSLAGALAHERVFPDRTIHLLELGEEAELGAMALRAAQIHEEKARIGLQRLVSLLVPVITILMGAVVAGIVSALLLAMLSLNDLAG